MVLIRHHADCITVGVVREMPKSQPLTLIYVTVDFQGPGMGLKQNDHVSCKDISKTKTISSNIKYSEHN
jgi:hypothetical protein